MKNVEDIYMGEGERQENKQMDGQEASVTKSHFKSMTLFPVILILDF
jgi:hypothetical protein